MDKLILLFSSLLIGIVVSRTKLFKAHSKILLNKVLIYFFVPILTLNYLPVLEFKLEHAWLVITPWLVYLFSFLFFEVLNKVDFIEKETRATLIMTSGIGSISFAGFPVFETFYGEEGLTYGIVLSLAGTFVVCNTLGSFTGFWYKSKETKWTSIFSKIFSFPPFLAMLGSFVLMLLDYDHPDYVSKVLDVLSAPFSVLALFTIGLNVNTKSLVANKEGFFLGQLYKLLVAPLLIFAVLLIFAAHDTVIGKICILGAGLGSMNTMAIIAAQLNLNPPLAFLMPALGIPISIFTVILVQVIFLS